MATEHEQTHVKVGDIEADIDVGIAPLIEEMWKAGIDTFNSCEENKPGIMWVEFATTDDACKFLNIVAKFSHEANSLYNRITGGWDGASRPYWKYDVHPEDVNVERESIDDIYIEEKPCGKPCFVFSCSIRFPNGDYPVLLRRMQKHNSRNDNKKPSPFSMNPGVPRCMTRESVFCSLHDFEGTGKIPEGQVGPSS